MKITPDKRVRNMIDGLKEMRAEYEQRHRLDTLMLDIDGSITVLEDLWKVIIYEATRFY